MIDLLTEQVIALNDVPDHIPPLRGGKPVHPGTVYLWASKGRGGIKLERAYLGGQLVTSLEAIQRFMERLTARADGPAVAAAQDQARRAAKARKRLAAYGI